jgi:hypothetical protein
MLYDHLDENCLRRITTISGWQVLQFSNTCAPHQLLPRPSPASRNNTKATALTIIPRTRAQRKRTCHQADLPTDDRGESAPPALFPRVG